MLYYTIIHAYNFKTNKEPADLNNTVDQMEKAMAPHSSTLAWKIPGTEEPGGLQSMYRYRQHIKKQRHCFANKGPSSQGYGFSSSHVWM